MTKPRIVFLVVFLLFALTLIIALYTWNQSLKAMDVPYLANTPVDRVAFDGQGQVWVYGGGKLSVYKDSLPIRVFTKKDLPVLGGNIAALEVDDQGRTWVVSLGSVAVFDGTIWSTLRPASGSVPSNGRLGIQVLAIDLQGRAWIGTEYQGFLIFDGENWENYTADNSDLLSNNVRCIAFDNQGRAWIGTQGETQESGINIFDGKTWQTFTTEDSPLHETAGAAEGVVRAIAFDQQGRAWIVSRYGLQVVDGGNWKRFSYTPYTSDIAVDGLGRVWTNSNEGIQVFDGVDRKYYFDTFNYAEFEEHIKNSDAYKRIVYGGSYFFGKMATDNDGNIWIPSKKGAVIISPDSPQPISYAAGILSIFITTNGLIYLTILLLVAWSCIALNAWRSLGFSLLGLPIYFYWIMALNDLSYIEFWFSNLYYLHNFFNNPGFIGTIAGITGGCFDILLAKSGRTRRTWWGLSGFIIGMALSSCPLLLRGVT